MKATAAHRAVHDSVVLIVLVMEAYTAVYLNKLTSRPAFSSSEIFLLLSLLSLLAAIKSIHARTTANFFLISFSENRCMRKNDVHFFTPLALVLNARGIRSDLKLLLKVSFCVIRDAIAEGFKKVSSNNQPFQVIT